MRKIRIGILVAIMILFGIAAMITKENGSVSTVPQSMIQVQASWQNGYDSIESLVKNSKLIAVGTISAQSSELRHDLAFTKQTIDLKDIRKDVRSSATSTLDQIVLLQTGGSCDGITTQTIEGAPLLETGKTYLLFLDESAEGHFLVMGGVEGAYEMSGNLLVDRSDGQNPLAKSVISKKVSGMLDEVKKWNPQGVTE